MEADEAEEKINSLKADVEAEIKDWEAEQVGINKEMAALKVLLYAKFGQTINLELDPEDD